MKIEQGHIYLAKLYPSNSKLKKIRPCIVIQSDKLNKILETTVIIPISSQIAKNQSIYEIPVIYTFLEKPSVALTYQIQAIDKKRFLKELGKIEDDLLDKIIRSVNLVIYRN